MRALAERGVDGARDMLRRAGETDPELRARLERLRDRLRGRSVRRINRLMGEYDRRAEEISEYAQKSDEEVRRQIAELEARLAKTRAFDWSNVPADLSDEIESALLAPDASWNRPPPRPGVFARLRAAFARFWQWLRGLFRRRPAGRPRAARERTVTFAVPSAGGRAIGASPLGDSLARLTAPQREELTDRVSSSLRERERALEREAEERRRTAEAQRRRLEEERAEARRRAEANADQQLRDAEEHRFQRELKERGFVAERAGELVVTYGLVERFAKLLLDEERRQLPANARMSMKGGGATGVYEKARLQRLEEVAHLDVPSSLLEARLTGSHHIDESTSYVYREITAERVHVVLAFDRSGSMTEDGKLDAAKKALLALYVAIRRRHSDATIDLLAFENVVTVLDLVELWECKAGAFTNTAEAIRAAHLLLRSSRANRRELYLITDGLPEAYTADDGTVRSGQLDVALEAALARARELATVPSLRSTLILLKSAHPEYETAARTIAQTLGGELVVTDPGRLGVELLVRWAHGTQVERKVLAPAAVAPRPPAVPRGKRRRADRRMGG